MRNIIQKLRFLIGSKEFDRTYYLTTYPDIKKAGVNPFKHFMETGWREGRNPSAQFSTDFYLGVYQDVRNVDVNPIDHYRRHGKKEGRRSFPVVDIDVEEVRHYFDNDYYLQENADIASMGIDSFSHFMTHGWRENRRPRADFDCEYYRNTYEIEGGLDPLTHYLAYGQARGFSTNSDGTDAETGNAIPPGRDKTSSNVLADIRRFANPGPYYEDLDDVEEGESVSKDNQVKAFAYYLPQFHAIPENDEWWGKGFTEWRNTARGAPRFKEHYQPRIPERLGFYDLNNIEVMKKQIELAKAGGIHGFCFYYYWFDGKRLLEMPLDNLLENKDIDFPFSILWANENWTRRWDGQEADVLLAQNYKEEEEDNFIADLARYFKDPRYHRVDDRPMFYIYRVGLIPDAKKTIKRWRQKFVEQHDLNPFMLMAQSFGDHDPNKYGLDGAIEFPPHKIGVYIEEVSGKTEIYDPEFTGRIHRYDDLIEDSMAVEKPDFDLIKTVAPSWDNEARRQGLGSTVYHGSTPQKFGNWLARAADFARQNPFHDEPMLMINAWNEWAEGAYLEPDVHFGAAYLNAARKALSGKTSIKGSRKLLLVGHDAYRHGAQMLLLHIAEYLIKAHGIEVAIVLRSDGMLLEDYQAIAPTYVLKGNSSAVQETLRSLKKQGFEKAISNTTVSSRFLATLEQYGIESILLVHELPSVIEQYHLETAVKTAAQKAKKLVFPAKAVQDGFEKILTSELGAKAVIRPQGNYKEWRSDEKAIAEIRNKVCNNPDDKIVFNAGYADLRKGFDLFCSVANLMRKKRPDIHFVWLGDVNPDLQRWVSSKSGENEEGGNLHIFFYEPNPVPFFEASDLFFLTSREDPFPTVVLEAFQAGIPVVGFEDSGGSVDIIREHGKLVEMGNVVEAMEAIETLIDSDEETKAKAAKNRKTFVLEHFRFQDYVFDLNQMLYPSDVKVSVVVPNYNYENHLKARLDSIYNQNYPIYETIILDDCSSDNSVKKLEAYKTETGRHFQLVLNENNSGSGYKQWYKGAQLCKGDYIWIAEADDLSMPEFLDDAIELLEESGAAFVFCDSKQIDENGKALAESYGAYLEGIERQARNGKAIFKGKDFVRDYLSVKNIILNVSGVVWRKEALLAMMQANEPLFTEMNLALDWKLYVDAALEYGCVGYIDKSHNVHRRHAASVTHAMKAEKHFEQILRVQDHIAEKLALNEEIEARRVSYREEVAEYLGVNRDK